MRKIIGIIIILVVGAVVCFVYLSFNQRVMLGEPFLCEGQSCNVILIIPESTSAQHMGIYGYERDTTPFIDEFFGEEGVVFENAWSNAPLTFSSFAALFTSQLPPDVFMETIKDKLSDEIPTFVGVLGKGGIPKFFAYANIPDESLVKRFESEERFMAGDTYLFSKATEWLKTQAQKDNKQPFFLLLQPFAPHAPYDPPEPYRFFFDAPSEYLGPVTGEDLKKILANFNQGEDVEAELQRFRLQYDQSLRHLDSQIESFISQIPEETLHNTIFIFTSDHGQAFLQHGNVRNGGTLYEEEIHIPFLIKAPGVNPKRIKEPISLLDAGPTILEIFDLKSPDTFQGTSLLPLLQGKELQLEKRIVRAELVYLKYPLKEDPQVRTEPFSSWGARFITVRKGPWKLFKREYNRIEPTSFELYNLERDYKEQNNLTPQWHFLSQEEQTQILPLFEALNESPPL